MAYALPVAVHVAAGGVAILAGFAALAARKGGRGHRLTGSVFFVAMLTMAGTAAVMALLAGQKLNTFAGLFTLYLVGTAWATVRRPAGTVGRFEGLALLYALGVATAGYVIGGMIASTPGGLPDGDPSSGAAPTGYFVFASLALLGAVLDVRMLRRGGVSGASRISRHLWRMCAGLAVATGSFFLGQADEIPASLHGPHLYALALAPLAALVFWLVRVRVGGRFRGAMAARAGSAQAPVRT